MPNFTSCCSPALLSLAALVAVLAGGGFAGSGTDPGAGRKVGVVARTDSVARPLRDQERAAPWSGFLLWGRGEGILIADRREAIAAAGGAEVLAASLSRARKLDLPLAYLVLRGLRGGAPAGGGRGAKRAAGAGGGRAGGAPTAGKVARTSGRARGGRGRAAGGGALAESEGVMEDDEGVEASGKTINPSTLT